MANTYLAEFDAPDGKLWVAAVKWSVKQGPLLDAQWWRILQSSNKIDITLRIETKSDPAVLLLLASDDAESLNNMIELLNADSNGTNALHAKNSEDFDAFVGLNDYTFHLRAHHDGYYRDNHQLACDFRLYSNWLGRSPADNVIYQVCLRGHPANPEQERRVRKYIAWLDLEQPFSKPVREMQTILSQRLLGSTWLADEYLLFTESSQLVSWQQKINEYFLETTGGIGFTEAPLEAGDFSDMLTIGYHTARDENDLRAVPVEAATAFTDDEIVWLARQRLATDTRGAYEAEPEIFISYASADFAEADAARQYLESNGRRCWIAPRDINNNSLPYSQAIPQAIRNAVVVVVLVSASANLSEHIPRELDLAVEQKLPIIPLRLAEILPSGQLEYFLRTCQWLDLFDRDHTAAMEELLTRINFLGVPASL